MARRDFVGVAESFHAIGSGVGDRHDAEPLGVVEGPSPIDEVSALTGPNQDRVGHFGLTQGTARGYR